MITQEKPIRIRDCLPGLILVVLFVGAIIGAYFTAKPYFWTMIIGIVVTIVSLFFIAMYGPAVTE